MSKSVEEQGDDQPRRIKVRIESLSDLVFGLALSIGLLEFLSSPARDPLGLARNLAFFGFSFFILVFTWLGYSRTMAVVQVETEASLYPPYLLNPRSRDNRQVQAGYARRDRHRVIFHRLHFADFLGDRDSDRSGEIYFLVVIFRHLFRR